MKFKKILLLILLSLFTLTKAASTLEDKQFLLIMLDGITIPMFVEKPAPDITPPVKPVLTIAPDDTTYTETTYVSIGGEVGSLVYVNGNNVGTIDASGTLIIGLDTSGDEGIKQFSIVLRDRAGNNSQALVFTITKIADPKYNLEYKGLVFYQRDMPPENYTLGKLSDSTFNALTQIQKLQVANKLLSTLFFGYPQNILLEKINSGHFISDVYNGLNEEHTDKEWLESYIIDSDIFYQSRYGEQEATDIITRFYAMKHLDKYFLNNWMAYILTQTILFSPAYELDTAHAPNIASVYSRIVSMLNVDSGMRYISYVHMMSEDNWRRFRSPEDNGREMLELFALDEDDAHVPIAGKALQNWKLDETSDTLVVGLNQNRQPLNLFGTIIFNGDDFYRELAKSSLFTNAVTTRIVNLFFSNETTNKKSQIISSIVSSNPETWKDIMLQIVFSEDYLLHSSRAKSAEELFFSLAKKMEYKHRTSTLYIFKESLEDMNQASMKYKLGRYDQVPLDTLSFSTYHKYIRENIFLRKSDPRYIDDYNNYSRIGWSESFVANENFNFQENNVIHNLESFVQYLFNATIMRSATSTELTLFREHMTYMDGDTIRFHDTFNISRTRSNPEDQISSREARKRNIAFIVLDYISRLSETYTHMEVN